MIYFPGWFSVSALCGGDGLLVWIPLAIFDCRDGFFDKFLLESLILAQDERWRRA